MQARRPCRDSAKASARPEPKVRAVAAEVLQQMGAAGRGARDALLAALDDPNRWVRYYAIDALGYLGAERAPAAERLAEFVAAPDAFARRHAIEALGRIGPEARDAVEALEKAAAEDPDLDGPLVGVEGLEADRGGATGPRGPPRSQRRNEAMAQGP